jgi:hypothetical protein
VASEFIDLDDIEKIAGSWGVYSDERGLISWRLPALVRAVRASIAFQDARTVVDRALAFKALTEALAPFRKEAT